MNEAQWPNEIERQALDKLLAGEHPALERLRRQLIAATVLGRERTDAGFVTRLGVPDGSRRLANLKPFQILDVYGKIDGLGAEASFILFVENGVLARLEGQILEGTWPASPRLERLYYMRPKAEGSAHLVEVPGRDLDWALAGAGAIAGSGSGEDLREMVMKTPRDSDLDLGATQDVAAATARLRARAKAKEEAERASREADAAEPAVSEEGPGGSPEAALSNRRTMALVAVNAVLATLLGTVLVAMLVAAGDGLEAAPAAGAAPEDPLLQVLLILAVAGGAGACLANLAALFRQSREPESLPVRQEVFYYLRPLVGALTALLAFLVVSTAVFAFTAGTGAGSWSAPPARTAYVAMSLLAGLSAYEVLDGLRRVLRALLPD